MAFIFPIQNLIITQITHVMKQYTKVNRRTLDVRIIWITCFVKDNKYNSCCREHHIITVTRFFFFSLDIYAMNEFIIVQLNEFKYNCLFQLVNDQCRSMTVGFNEIHFVILLFGTYLSSFFLFCFWLLNFWLAAFLPSFWILCRRRLWDLWENRTYLITWNFCDMLISRFEKNREN